MVRHHPWWSLPGPAEFIRGINQDLGEGKNVIIALPQHHPAERGCILTELEALNEYYYFSRLDLSETPIAPNLQPAYLVHREFDPLEEGGRADCLSVVRSESLRGRIIWMEGLTTTTWPRWRQFLLDYSNLVRNRDQAGCVLFCVLLEGAIAVSPGSPDVALAVRAWRGATDRLDMLLYVSRLLKGRDEQPLRHELMIAIITEFAGFDPALASYLAQHDLDELLEPFALLQRFGADRGWNAACCNTKYPRDVAWAMSMEDNVDNELAHQLAARAIAGDQQAVEHRLWRAQLGILLPHLEKRRRLLINRYRQLLKPPPADQLFEQNENPLELIEFSGINAQLRGRLSTRDGLLLQSCVNMRNRLAHGKPVWAQDLKVLLSFY